MTKKTASWPKMLYREGGEHRVFDAPEDVPAADGWKTYDELNGVVSPPDEDEDDAALFAAAKELVAASQEAAVAAQTARDEALLKLEAVTAERDIAKGQVDALTDQAAKDKAAVAAAEQDRDAAPSLAEGLQKDLDAARAEIAKVDGDKDGKVGGSDKKSKV